MQARFISISAYEDEIARQQKAMDALFNLILKNDVAGMDTLEKQ